jgi:hypothetical protein
LPDFDFSPVTCSVLSFQQPRKRPTISDLQEEKLDVVLVLLVYASVCKLAVNASLCSLDVEQLNISDVHRLEWEVRMVFVEMLGLF